MNNGIILAVLILLLFVPVLNVIAGVALFWFALRGLVLKKTVPVLGQLDSNLKVAVFVLSIIGVVSGNMLLMLLGGLILFVSALAGLQR